MIQDQSLLPDTDLTTNAYHYFSITCPGSGHVVAVFLSAKINGSLRVIESNGIFYLITGGRR